LTDTLAAAWLRGQGNRASRQRLQPSSRDGELEAGEQDADDHTNICSHKRTTIAKGRFRAMRTAVVTGATSGIGEATAVGLAAKGWRVAIVARNEAKARATRERILAGVADAEIDVFLGDLALADETHRLAGELTERLERI